MSAITNIFLFKDNRFKLSENTSEENNNMTVAIDMFY